MTEKQKEDANKDVWSAPYIRSLDGAEMIALSPNNYVAKAVKS